MLCSGILHLNHNVQHYFSSKPDNSEEKSQDNPQTFPSTYQKGSTTSWTLHGTCLLQKFANSYWLLCTCMYIIDLCERKLTLVTGGPKDSYVSHHWKFSSNFLKRVFRHSFTLSWSQLSKVTSWHTCRLHYKMQWDPFLSWTMGLSMWGLMCTNQ